MLHIRFQYSTGASLGYSVERLADGARFDFAAGAFAASGVAPPGVIDALPEGKFPFLGQYRADLDPSPAWDAGAYTVAVHDLAASDTVVAELAHIEAAAAACPPVAAPLVAGAGRTATLWINCGLSTLRGW